MQIRCNNQKRPVIYGFELTEKERAEFDYLDDIENAQFFRYKRAVYDLGEFMRIGPNIAPHPQRPGWEKFDGYSSDSFFSGVLVKFCDDYEFVIVGQYFC
jgi:hypothetical protein